MKAKFQWSIIDNLLVSVASTGELPDEEWKLLLNEIKTKPIRAYLQVVMGTLEMTSAQRKLGIDVVNQKHVRVGVLTEDKVVRGLVTAASWFNVDVKAFPWKDAKLALTFLGVSDSKMDIVLASITRLKASVAPAGR